MKSIQIGLLVCALALHASAVEFFVTPSGDDLNAGTAGAPFQTLEKAQLAVRSALPTATEPIQVWVGGGTYYLDQALEFGPADSGTASVPVTYAGVSNETVVISGAIPLSPTWSTHSGNILVADVGTGLSFDVLFADSEQQVLARYPDFSAATVILNGYASDAISSSRVASWSDPTTGLVRGLHHGEWGGQSYKITGVETDGTPTLEWVGDNNRGSSMHSTYRMVENIFEELDAPGEWFYDEATGNLYFYPPAGLNAATASFEAASVEELFRVVGNASTKVKYLTFDNFTFTQTRRTLFTRPSVRPLRSDWGIARAGAIYLDNAENVTISNSTFDHLGGNGVFSSGYNRNHLITENEFTEIGATCVHFVGLLSAVRYPSFWDNDDHKTDIQDTTPGPLTDDYPKDCTVSYNHMQDMGRFEKQTCGVNLSMSESITVSHNTVHGSPRAGLNVCDGTWGGHLFEFNDVFDCVRETSDHGPFNAWGRDRFWSYLGFNTTGSEGPAKKPYAFLDAWKTTVIRNNRFHYEEPSRFGIDLDDGSTNYEVYNNLMLNTALKLREGFGRKAYNNIMINQPAEFHVWYDECGDIFTNNIILNSKAYSVVSVDIGSSQATIDYNLFYNAGESVSVAFGGATDSHSLIADPLFVDTDMNDYTVPSNSPAIGLGYVNFPMDQFGKPGAPDPGPVDVVSAEDLAADSEPFMGAEACSIYSESIQSALGAPDLNGVYLRTVPTGSYAEIQGFQSGDVIRSINGTTITDKQNFWLLYHLIEPSTEVAITLLRNQIESAGSFTKIAVTEELNDTAGIVYSDDWSLQENADAFNGDLQYNRTTGACFELTFYGTGVEFTSQINSDMGDVDVYIDGVLDETISCYNASRVHQQTVYRQLDLTAGVHTLKAVNAETKYMILDSVTVHSTPSTILPGIVYTASGSSTAPAVSSSDLAQTQYLSSSATGGNGVATDHARLFNGVIGDENSGTDDAGAVTMDSGNTVTVTLDTSVNTLGYDLTGIDSYFGWSTGSGGRANQGYQITVTFVDGSTAILAGPEHWAPNSPASYWTTVSFSEFSGGRMATGVKSLTFDITEDANAGGVVVGREIDIFGVPTGDGTEHVPVFESGQTLSNSQIVLGFSGTIGQHYRVESIDDLMSSNSWQVVTDLVSLATSPVDVSVPVTNSVNFYRVIWIP